MIVVRFRSKLLQNWRNTVCFMPELYDYIQMFADDFRDLLCEYTFVTSMVGIIQFFHYREEQRVLLDAVEELAKYGIQFHNYWNV